MTKCNNTRCKDGIIFERGPTLYGRFECQICKGTGLKPEAEGVKDIDPSREKEKSWQRIYNEGYKSLVMAFGQGRHQKGLEDVAQAAVDKLQPEHNHIMALAVKRKHEIADLRFQLTQDRRLLKRASQALHSRVVWNDELMNDIDAHLQSRQKENK